MDRSKLLELPKLTKEDTVVFGCNECGKCCREREDILLTPIDLFKMAKYLQMPIQSFISKYCEHYMGGDSHMPLVRIKPREYRRSCPLNDKGRCLVHSVKPVVCALYPLGRMLNGETNEFTYFMQDVKCGNKRETRTIREWLEQYNMLEEEAFTIEWQKQFLQFCMEVMKLLPIVNQIMKDIVYMYIFTKLYIEYDITEDFMKQFENNCYALKAMLIETRVDILEK